MNSALVILAYDPSHSNPDAPENTDASRPLLQQALANNPFEQAKTAEKTHVVGIHSFEDLHNVESSRWEQIEMEIYERVHQTQASPSFRHFTPCLTNTTNNALKPRSIVNGMLPVIFKVVSSTKVIEM